MTTKYRSTDGSAELLDGGSIETNLAHSASVQSFDKDTPSKPGTKHLGFNAESDRQRVKHSLAPAIANGRAVRAPSGA